MQILIFGMIFAIANAQIPGFGTCPRVQVMQSFDISQFLGTWYVICNYPDKLMLDGRCAVTTFSWASNSGSNSNAVSLFSKHISLGKEKKFLGTANVMGAGVLAVEYPAAPKANAYYNVLDTDYSNYAVLFACNNYYGLANGQNLWILSRRKYLEPQFTQKAMEVMNMNGLSRLLLKHMDQNCDNPYPYPSNNNNGNFFPGKKF